MAQKLVTAWVAGVSRHPLFTLLMLLVITAAAAVLVQQRFTVDPEMRNLIREGAPWREEYDRLKQVFPELQDTALVVITGETVDAVQEGTRRLYQRVSTSGRFHDIFAPHVDPVLERHALLFLSLDTLETTGDRLAAAQPVLAAVSAGRGAAGILDVIDTAIGASEDAVMLEPLLQTLTASAKASAEGAPAPPAWRDPLLGDSSAGVRTSVLRVGRVKERDTEAEFLAVLRDIVDTTPLPNGTEARLTGTIPLAQEELIAAEEGIRTAGLIALLLLAMIFLLGIRSLRLFLGIAALLPTGMALTAAWGLLAVGSFNPISLVFAVVFFGLGVDFAIHFALRYREQLQTQPAAGPALTGAASSIGSTLLLCALTTAIGFLAFLPTDYRGVSELGIIAAGGMFIAVGLTLTLLPACFQLMGPPTGNGMRLPASISRIADTMLHHRRAMLLLCLVAAAASLFALRELRFEYSVIALKDPEAESVQTLRHLQRQRISNDYTISVLAEEEVEALHLETALEALPEVASVTAPRDYLPEAQDDKLYLLEDLRMLLGPYLEPAETAPNPDALRESIASLLQTASVLPTTVEHASSARALATALQGVAAGGDEALRDWERLLLDSLRDEMRWLADALSAQRLSFAMLPEGLRERLRSPEGIVRLSVMPAEDISESAALTRYVESVRQVAPRATGRPVIEKALGDIVQTAFLQALLLSLAAISIVLLLSLRSFKDTLLVLAPLVLATLLTAGTMVLAGVRLNMANVLVLPLIFGLGVDSSIHVVRRLRRGGDIGAFLESSTPRAVLLSSLTTVGSFAALAMAPHKGIASIGWLLAVAILWMLVFVIGVLPLLLGRPSSRASAAP